MGGFHCLIINDSLFCVYITFSLASFIAHFENFLDYVASTNMEK